MNNNLIELSKEEVLKINGGSEISEAVYSAIGFVAGAFAWGWSVNSAIDREYQFVD